MGKWAVTQEDQTAVPVAHRKPVQQDTKRGPQFRPFSFFIRTVRQKEGTEKTEQNRCLL